MRTADCILTHATILMADGQTQPDQAIVIAKGKIIWVGSNLDLPLIHCNSSIPQENCYGKLVTPGLIDCHTHLIYAGNRAHEFKQRLLGATYQDIARQGGGILSTVRLTRAASKEQLIEESLPRLMALRSEGVTTVEIKSGYGLDKASEIKMLEVARMLASLSGMRIKTTFLGAHALPVEYLNKPQAYIDFLCEELLPELVQLQLVDAVDAFCETIGFTLEQTQQLFLKAQALNLPIKCHAEQLSNIGASKMAASLNALSCDHLEFLDESGINAMATSNTVAVLLPGAYYFLRETQKPPINLLREAGVGIAIATDCNPGSSPTTSLLLMMNMACQLFDLTIAEVTAAVTFQAAKALGIEQETGRITNNLAADLVVWETNNSAELCYHFAYPLRHKTMIAGQWINY